MPNDSGDLKQPLADFPANGWSTLELASRHRLTDLYEGSTVVFTMPSRRQAQVLRGQWSAGGDRPTARSWLGLQIAEEACTLAAIIAGQSLV